MSEIRTDWQSGQPIPAKDMRSNSEALAGLLQSGRDDTSKGGGFNGNDARYVVKITAVNNVSDGVFDFDFEQVVWDTGTSNWIAASSPITQDTIGKITAQGRLDNASAAGVDDVVTIRPGSRVDSSGRRQWEFVPSGKQWYYAKVTASSSSTADITLAECDSDGTAITGGRTPTDARVPMERKGVPVDTYGIAFVLPPTTADGDPVTVFLPWDGDTTSPKDLVDTSVTADTTEWDIEQDSEPVNYLACRILDDTANSGFWYFYNRDIIADASGMTTFVDNEDRVVMPGDGYNETRHNNVQVDLIPSNGVLDFDDQQTPGTDELVVQWTLTGGQDADAGQAGNDGLRTKIQALVDASGLPNGSNTFAVVDKLVEAQATGTQVIDDDDYGGRLCYVGLFENTNEPDADFDADFGTLTNMNSVYFGATRAGAGDDLNIFSSGNHKLFIDADDGRKLKYECLIAPSSGSHWMRIVVHKYPSKSSADPDHVIT